MTGELAKALAAFQAEMPTVHKGKTANVPTKAGGSYSYSYADLADVTQAAMPVLARHGLSFSTCPSRTDQGYELVGMLLHTSGESLTGALPLTGRTPQEIGSSLTYNRRYLLGSMTGLVTDDDDDGAAGSRAPERLEQTPPPDPRSEARSRLAGVWRRHHGGELDPAEVARAFQEFASGKPFTEATPDELDAFARSVEHTAHEQTAEKFLDRPAGDLPPATTEAKATGTGPISQSQMRMLNALLGKAGLQDDNVHEWISEQLDRFVQSRSELTKADASVLIDRLNQLTGGKP